MGAGAQSFESLSQRLALLAKRKQKVAGAVIAASVLALAGCAMGGVSPSASTSNPTPSTPITTQSFASQPDGSFLFSTNDSGNKGQTFVQYTASSTTSGFTYTAVVSKASGQPGGGFGLVFQRQDNSNFWFVNIDTQGSYTVEKMVNGTLMSVTSSGSTTWVSSPLLRTGNGVTNTLSIIFDPVVGYTFSANGTVILPFTDTGMGAVYTSGSLGFDVGVLSTENFPDQAVSVTFNVTNPTALTW